MLAVGDGPLWTRFLPRGEFQAVYSWLGCGALVDPWLSLRRYDPAFAVPIGDRSPGYQDMARWQTPAAHEYGQRVDEIQSRQPGDNSVIVTQSVAAYALAHQETPFIPLVQATCIISLR